MPEMFKFESQAATITLMDTPSTVAEPVNPIADKDIREALISHLWQRSLSPRAVIEEVRVHNGNAIADVVAVYQAPHCYEIKGETDAIRRIVRQGEFYDRVFQRITLVTTSNHLRSAERLCPPHWGVLIAERGAVKIRLKYIRRASLSSSFDKQAALLTLWKRELIALCDGDLTGVEKISRQSLTNIIAANLAPNDVSKKIGEMLVNRQLVSGCPLSM